MTQTSPGAATFVPASVILRELHAAAPADHFTLDWLMGRLPKQSFGLIMLLLAILAIAPGICTVAGLMLLIPAYQMAVGRAGPAFPRWLSARPLPTRHVGGVVTRAIAVLAFLETVIHPRWPTPHETTKRVVGFAVLILTVRLVLMPIPLSNIAPAVVIALIALAYLEEDGLLLALALVAGLALFALEVGALWEIARGAKDASRLW